MAVRRRDFLIGALTGAGAGLAPISRSLAFVGEARSLSLYHIHTDERLKVVYRENGAVISAALEAVKYFLRDFRTGEKHAIDVALLDLLTSIHDLFDRRGNFEVISGYRSARTNEALRHVSSGVAKDSLHMFGRAIDVRLTSARIDNLRDAAIEVRRGGVGYYPQSNFVHIDTGSFRTW
jgi:uncharacterized protein YcbK (DUF882 family)